MEQPHNNKISDPVNKSGKKSLAAWFKKMGVAAFLFFLLKGIGWLVIGYFGLEMLGC